MSDLDIRRNCGSVLVILFYNGGVGIKPYSDVSHPFLGAHLSLTYSSAAEYPANSSKYIVKSNVVQKFNLIDSCSGLGIRSNGSPMFDCFIPNNTEYNCETIKLIRNELPFCYI